MQLSNFTDTLVGYLISIPFVLFGFLIWLIKPIKNGLTYIYHQNETWCIICLILFIVLELANWIIAKNYKSAVRAKSYIYQDILKLNEQYKFYELPSVFTFEKVVKSSQAFANFDMEKFAKEEFYEDTTRLTKCFEAASLNRFQLERYVEALRTIRRPLLSDALPSLFQSYFGGLEKEVYMDALAYPVINPIYKVYIKYDSPARRVRRRKETWCDQAYMEKLYKRIKKIHEYKPISFVEYLYREEAAKKASEGRVQQNQSTTDIPPKLRYDVMMRDQQQCIRCHRSAQDNVSLDVYHKIPLSKGGKTVFDNLYTLCDSCAADLSVPRKKARVRKVKYVSDEFIKAERARMTPEYKEYIKRRDNYRCQICGRGVQDGVRLEVDHIKPVSLGGTSDEENLRTLCFDCNRGKGATYDPYGPN